MKYLKILVLVFLTVSCENKRVVDIGTNKHSFIVPDYNSILAFDCNTPNLDTIEVIALLKNDSMSFWGKHIITSSNQSTLIANISYLNDEIIINRIPGYYGRNSKHLTFNLIDDSSILFSNDFILNDTIPMSDISKIINEYYFAEQNHLKYAVKKMEKGVDINISKNIDASKLQLFIDTLSLSYIEVVNYYCDLTFHKEYNNLSPNEVIHLLRDINFTTDIIICEVLSSNL